MIRLKNVSYTYPFQSGKAVDNVSFGVNQGEAVLCTGMSGCGKSTLVRLINGLIPHYHNGSLEGKVRVTGRDNKDRDIHEIAMDVGTLFQDPEHQFLTLNVSDELAFAHEWRGVAAGSIRDIIVTAAKRFGLSHLLNAPILSLSEGEKQKVALASVVSLAPKILVLDEPSANLDPTATIELARILKRLKETGMTLFIADHRLYWLKDLVDTVMVMSHGRIVQTGDFAILDDEGIRRTYGLRHSRVRDTAPHLSHAADIGHGDIQIDDLTFGYKSGALLFDADQTQLPAREVIAVLGKNGAGKTTFARLLTGLEKMASGTLSIHGQPTTPKKMLQRAGIVLQNTDHQLHMKTVYRELEVSARGMESPNGPARVRELLDFFNLDPVAQRHPQSLSGGEKQRLVIACGMIRNPDILILDEPTSGLDGANMRLIAQGINKIASAGACVLVISHDIELISMTATARLDIPLSGGK